MTQVQRGEGCRVRMSEMTRLGRRAERHILHLLFDIQCAGGREYIAAAPVYVSRNGRRSTTRHVRAGVCMHSFIFHSPSRAPRSSQSSIELVFFIE